MWQEREGRFWSECGKYKITVCRWKESIDGCYLWQQRENGTWQKIALEATVEACKRHVDIAARLAIRTD